MPKNLYKCEKCGHVFDDEQTCLACEAKHVQIENSIRVEWEWEDRGGSRGIPRRIKILIPDANNKPYGKWATYEISNSGVSKDPKALDDEEQVIYDAATMLKKIVSRKSKSTMKVDPYAFTVQAFADDDEKF